MREVIEIEAARRHSSENLLSIVGSERSGGTFNGAPRRLFAHRIYAPEKRCDCNAAVFSHDS
jgi:hypothetical protein